MNRTAEESVPLFLKGCVEVRSMLSTASTLPDKYTTEVAPWHINNLVIIIDICGERDDDSLSFSSSSSLSHSLFVLSSQSSCCCHLSSAWISSRNQFILLRLKTKAPPRHQGSTPVPWDELKVNVYIIIEQEGLDDEMMT